MTTVEQLIGDLLLRHNCVIIPSFGGFVAKPVSAKIDYDKGTMLPPSKSLLFNRQLINNDGLLVNEFAQVNKLSFDEASKALQETVATWNNQLTAGGRIEIDRVGNLFYDDERNICFEQDRFVNLLLESFGLGNVHFLTEEDVQIVEHKIHVEQLVEKVPEVVAPEPVIEAVASEQPVEKTPIISIVPKTEKSVNEEAQPRKRKAWRYVAAACILPIAFYSVWIPVKTDVLESGVVSIQDFNPFHKQSEGKYVSEEFTSDLKLKFEKKSLEDELSELESHSEYYTFKLDEETYIKVELDREVTSDPSEDIEPFGQEVVEANTMHFIVGCFGQEENAINLVAKLKANGLDGKIVDVKNGLHRVSAGGAISLESYHQIKAQAESLGLSGWKLK
jgi:hypothetical protein